MTILIPIITFVVLVSITLITVQIFRIIQKKKLNLYVQKNNYEYFPKSDELISPGNFFYFSSFVGTLTYGESHTVLSNFIKGKKNNQEFIFFDSKVSGRKTGLLASSNSTASTYSKVYVINLKKKIPKFVIRAETYIDELKSKFGLGDLNFEEDYEFSKKFDLTGDLSSKDLFTPELRKLLLDKSNDKLSFGFMPSYYIESSGNQLLITLGTTYGVKYFDQYLDDILEIASYF